MITLEQGSTGRYTEYRVRSSVLDGEAIMSTEPKLWPLSTLRSARLDANGSHDVDPENPVVFTIPQFQRSLVWPEEKQRDLIQSILKGFPLGALLLVEYPKKTVTLPNGKQVEADNYGIIDGLQRTNAIVSHLRKSLAFATGEAVAGKEFENLHAALNKELNQTFDESAMMDAVIGWMAETEKPDMAEGFDFDTMLDSISSGLSAPIDATQKKSLKTPASKLLAHIVGRVDISHMHIPVLVYKGPFEYLPDIFEKINTAGTVLSKYEVYAAAWAFTEVEVKNRDVQAAIARRYDVLEVEGFDVEPVGEDQIYSLFDYLHGLSQVLGEKFPVLFSSKEAQNNALSGAFPLATLMLGRGLDKMGKLDELFPKQVSNPNRLDVDSFETALFAAAQFVNDALAPFLAFKFESDREAPSHGELQIVSMIAATAANLYDHTAGFTDRGSAAGRNALRKKLETALPQHYIYDIIRQYWRGSLYTYAAERVWEGSNPSGVYVSEVDPKSFDAALKTLYTEQMAKVSHRRSNVTAFDRVFLKFVYSRKVSVQDQSANKFDVEHWLPIKRLQNLTAGREPWPMGAMGNLGVLPRGANRIKREETVSEYIGRTNKKPTNSQVTLLKALLFVPVAQISFRKDLNGADRMSLSQFQAFVKKNWDAMCADLKANIGL